MSDEKLYFNEKATKSDSDYESDQAEIIALMQSFKELSHEEVDNQPDSVCKLQQALKEEENNLDQQCRNDNGKDISKLSREATTNETTHGQGIEEFNLGSTDNSRRPTRFDAKPRRYNLRSADQLASTSESCLTLSHSKNKRWNKLTEVSTSSGDKEDTKNRRKSNHSHDQLKKARFSDEVEVWHYDKESGEQYLTIIPLADESNQPQRSYKRGDERIYTKYPRTSLYQKIMNMVLGNCN